MHGNDRGLFEPNGAVTRAAVIMTLWNREKNPVVDYLMQFSDVKEGQWYTEAVRWAASEGIIDGYEDGTLRPDRPVNREELTAMLYRYEQYKGGGFTGAWMFPLPFSDSAKVSAWAYEAVAWCSMNKIVNGKDDGAFDPAGNAKRCELAKILTAYLTMEK